MSANRQATIGRRWGQFKPSQWGQSKRPDLIIVLVGCGYEREALAPARTLVEAVIRGRQLSADDSGGVGRTLLKGRKPGSLKAAASRFGQESEIESWTASHTLTCCR